MTQEDKDLLIKDLCARLPYEVKASVNSEYLSEELIKVGYNEPLVIYGITADGSISFTLDKFLMEYSMPILSIKPYLFPLSSMTEEQKKELDKKFHVIGIYWNNIKICYHSEGYWDTDLEVDFQDWLWLINWLNKNHFDYRGLIEKGLAIDCTNLNIY